MNSEELTHKAEEEIAALISKKVAELRKKTGQEVSEIEFAPSITWLLGGTPPSGDWFTDVRLFSVDTFPRPDGLPLPKNEC